MVNKMVSLTYMCPPIEGVVMDGTNVHISCDPVDDIHMTTLCDKVPYPFFLNGALSCL